MIVNPEVKNRLTDEVAVENYVKEILRLHSPVQCTGRLNIVDLLTEWGKIPAGSTLTLCLSTTNRHPGHFENSDQLLIQRRQKDHLSFGYGIHHCLGHQLEILEARAVVGSVLRKRTTWHIVEEPHWSPKYTIRSMTKMIIEET